MDKKDILGIFSSELLYSLYLDILSCDLPTGYYSGIYYSMDIFALTFLLYASCCRFCPMDLKSWEF